MGPRGAARAAGGARVCGREGETADEASLEPYGLPMPVALLHFCVAEVAVRVRSVTFV